MKTLSSILLFVLLVLGLASPSHALCVSGSKTDMEGTWYDAFGFVKKIEIEFSCGDALPFPPEPTHSPPPAYVTVWGACAKISGICNWGTTRSTLRFTTDDNGTTRVDAVYDDGEEKRTLVILKVNSEELLVFVGVEHPDYRRDGFGFSTLQSFTKDESCQYWRGTVFCRDPRLGEFLMRDLVPE
jgi:hypothetical protein